jgi:hypothetical protein
MSQDTHSKDRSFQTLRSPDGRTLKIRNEFIAAVVPRTQGNWADIHAKVLVRDANQCRTVPISAQPKEVQGDFVDFKDQWGATVRVKPAFVTMVQGPPVCTTRTPTTIVLDAGGSAEISVADSADEVERRLKMAPAP